MNVQKSVFIFVYCISASVVLSAHWNYQNFPHWGEVAKICVNGNRQSPINLDSRNATVLLHKTKVIELHNYQITTRISFRNNGHSVELVPEYSERKPTMSGVALGDGVYALKSAHLHWGTENRRGSEHNFRGSKNAAELHLVHFNVKYGSFEKAVSQKDGLAVIGVPYVVNDIVKPSDSAYLLNYLLDKHSTEKPGKNPIFCNCKMSHLQPKLKRLFAYDGSLTTPPCSENVRWIVQEDSEIIPSSIMRRLRDITLNDDDKTNVREIQNDNGRRVDYYIRS